MWDENSCSSAMSVGADIYSVGFCDELLSFRIKSIATESSPVQVVNSSLAVCGLRRTNSDAVNLSSCTVLIIQIDYRILLSVPVQTVLHLPLLIIPQCRVQSL